MSERPWLKHYDPGVQHTLQPYPDSSLLEYFSESARQRPEHPLLLFKGARLSYGRVERQARAFAAALQDLGLQKGDRLALLMPNCPQMVIAQLGGWRAGAVIAPLNPLYTEQELEYTIQQSGAEIAVVLTPFYEKLKRLQPRTALRKVIAANIKEYLPSHLRLLFTLLKEKKEGHRVTLQPGDQWFSDLLRSYSSSPPPDVQVDPQDQALFLFSGGTTGTPKAAVGTHKALLSSALQIHAWFTGMLTDWQDVLLQVLPLFHIYGNVGVFGTGLISRGSLALVPNPRDLDDLVATIRRTRPNFIPAVPTLFIALLNYPAIQAGKVDLSFVRVCISGAAPLMAETKRRFEALTGGRIVEGFAMTETMMAAVVTPVLGLYKEGAVGIPLPDVEIRIADVESGEGSLGPGEVGEILIRAPNLMLGYWQQPVETSNVIRDGWLHSGDIGYLDEDGYMTIVDRKKDLIKVGGFQVWPREVEEVIASHPAVQEVGVAGMPDAYQGESVHAWVVVRSGGSLTAEDLRLYCKERLAAYKVPRQIEFRDSLPKTMVGKVLRRELVRGQVPPGD